jgi:hypothetical protein
MPRGPLKKCKAVAAAQYILIAGKVMGRYYFSTDLVASGLGPQQWKKWAQGFAKMAADEENEADVREAAERAYNFMISGHPELL